MHRGVIAVGKRLVSLRIKRLHRNVVFVTEAIKNAHACRLDLPVEPAKGLGLAQWRVVAARQPRERRIKRYRIQHVLLNALCRDEEKQLVLDDWTAEPSTEVVPLKRHSHADATQVGSHGIVAEQIEPFAMPTVAALPR